VALVLKDKLWAYPWLIALLLAFIAYRSTGSPPCTSRSA
jgi:hypothetical protein